MGSASNDSLSFRLEDVDLPVISGVAMEAMRLVSDGQTNAADIEKIIRVDQALAARILRLSNSPVFCGKVPVRSIRQAVTRLGVRHLRAALYIAASSELFDQSDHHVREFWSHGLATALASHWLSERLGIRDSDECFVAGLLHDVGKVLIYRQAAEAYGNQWNTHGPMTILKNPITPHQSIYLILPTQLLAMMKVISLSGMMIIWKMFISLTTPLMKVRSRW